MVCPEVADVANTGRKPLPQVGQKWVGTVLLVLVLVALALRAARFCSA